MASSESDSETSTFLMKDVDGGSEKKQYVEKQNVGNIDYDKTGRITFYWLFVLLEFTAISILITVIVWITRFYNGFDWRDVKKMFGFHPLCMTLGLVLLYGNSAVVYRVLRNQEKFTVKIIHTFLHSFALISTVIGLAAIFYVNQKQGFDHMYTLHSWVGMGTVVLFVLQLVFGFTAFLFPKFSDKPRKEYLSIHVFFGTAILVMAIATCILGITEEMLFSHMADYSKFVPVGNIANVYGMLLIFFGALVTVILSTKSYKRIRN